MNNINLLKQLIEIPSYVDIKNNEIEIGEYLYQYLQQFAWLSVKKDFVRNGRFNIIAKDNYPTSVLFTGHMDTVQPREGWKTNQFISSISNGKLYGLGASDMKSSIATLLESLKQFKQTKGLMLLFYVDEEYDFLGTKHFITNYKDRIKPNLIISGDGNDLTLANGCRGVIEVTFIAKGLSAHASNPQEGKNAILKSVSAITKLTQELGKTYTSKDLGESSCNLAFLNGGLLLGNDKNQKLIIGREGNNIADVAEFVLDIRPSTLKLTAKKVIKLLNKYLKEEDLSLISYKIRHNLPPWITEKKQLKQVERIIQKTIPVNYKKLGGLGYSDVQMLWETFGHIPCFTFGAGNGLTVHKPNEYILLKDLEKLKIIYIDFIKNFANGITSTLC